MALLSSTINMKQLLIEVKAGTPRKYVRISFVPCYFKEAYCSPERITRKRSPRKLTL